MIPQVLSQLVLRPVTVASTSFWAPQLMIPTTLFKSDPCIESLLSTGHEQIRKPCNFHQHRSLSEDVGRFHSKYPNGLLICFVRVCSTPNPPSSKQTFDRCTLEQMPQAFHARALGSDLQDTEIIRVYDSHMPPYDDCSLNRSAAPKEETCSSYMHLFATVLVPDTFPIESTGRTPPRIYRHFSLTKRATKRSSVICNALDNFRVSFPATKTFKRVLNLW